MSEFQEIRARLLHQETGIRLYDVILKKKVVANGATGHDLVDFIVNNGISAGREEATQFCQKLLDARVLLSDDSASFRDDSKHGYTISATDGAAASTLEKRAKFKRVSSLSRLRGRLSRRRSNSVDAGELQRNSDAPRATPISAGDVAMLLKRGGKRAHEGKPYYWSLAHGKLYYGAALKGRPQGHFNLNIVKSYSVENNDLQLETINTGGLIVIEAPSEEVRDQWMVMLSAYVSKKSLSPRSSSTAQPPSAPAAANARSSSLKNFFSSKTKSFSSSKGLTGLKSLATSGSGPISRSGERPVDPGDSAPFQVSLERRDFFHSEIDPLLHFLIDSAQSHRRAAQPKQQYFTSLVQELTAAGLFYEAACYCQYALLESPGDVEICATVGRLLRSAASGSASLSREGYAIDAKYKAALHEARRQLANSVAGAPSKIYTHLAAFGSTVYSKVLGAMFEECVLLAGKPPCKYAVCDWAHHRQSLLLPYDSVRLLVILQDPSEHCVQYFRRVLEAFAVLVASLGETPMPVFIPEWSGCISPGICLESLLTTRAPYMIPIGSVRQLVSLNEMCHEMRDLQLQFSLQYVSLIAGASQLMRKYVAGVRSVVESFLCIPVGVKGVKNMTYEVNTLPKAPTKKKAEAFREVIAVKDRKTGAMFERLGLQFLSTIQQGMMYENPYEDAVSLRDDLYYYLNFPLTLFCISNGTYSGDLPDALRESITAEGYFLRKESRAHAAKALQVLTRLRVQAQLHCGSHSEYVWVEQWSASPRPAHCWAPDAAALDDLLLVWHCILPVMSGVIDLQQGGPKGGRYTTKTFNLHDLNMDPSPTTTAMFYTQMRMYKRALQELEPLTEAVQVSGLTQLQHVHYGLAMSKLRTDDTNGALVELGSISMLNAEYSPKDYYEDLALIGAITELLTECRNYFGKDEDSRPAKKKYRIALKMNEGSAALKRGDYQDAADAYTEATQFLSSLYAKSKTDHRHKRWRYLAPLIRHCLGVALRLSGRTTEAETSHRMAMKVSLEHRDEMLYCISQLNTASCLSSGVEKNALLGSAFYLLSKMYNSDLSNRVIDMIIVPEETPFVVDE